MTSPILVSTAAAPAGTLESLYRTHAGSVRRFAVHLGGSTSELDDLVQEVFVVAGERLGTFRGDADVRTWLFAITRNIVRHRRRTAQRTMHAVLAEEPPSTDPTPEESLARRQAVTALSNAVAELDDRYRETLLLHAVEGLTGPEIARRTGVEPATVWVRLHRARHLIRAALIKGAIILAILGAGTAIALEIVERVRKEPPPPATNGHLKEEPMKKLTTAVFAAWMFVPAIAPAAEEPRPTKKEEVVYQRRTVLEFNEEYLSGELTRPSGSYITTRGRTRFPLLVQLRTDFRPELMRSIDELRSPLRLEGYNAS